MKCLFADWSLAFRSQLPALPSWHRWFPPRPLSCRFCLVPLFPLLASFLVAFVWACGMFSPLFSPPCVHNVCVGVVVSGSHHHYRSPSLCKLFLGRTGCGSFKRTWLGRRSRRRRTRERKKNRMIWPRPPGRRSQPSNPVVAVRNNCGCSPFCTVDL